MNILYKQVHEVDWHTQNIHYVNKIHRNEIVILHVTPNNNIKGSSNATNLSQTTQTAHVSHSTSKWVAYGSCSCSVTYHGLEKKIIWSVRMWQHSPILDCQMITGEHKTVAMNQLIWLPLCFSGDRFLLLCATEEIKTSQ